MTDGFQEKLRQELVDAAARKNSRTRFLRRRRWAVVYRNLCSAEVMFFAVAPTKYAAVWTAHRGNEAAQRSWKATGIPPLYLVHAEQMPFRVFPTSNVFRLKLEYDPTRTVRETSSASEAPEPGDLPESEPS